MSKRHVEALGTQSWDQNHLSVCWRLCFPAVSRSRRTVQASRLRPLCDATGAYSKAWLILKSLGGKMLAGKQMLDGYRNVPSRLYLSV
jgi:hypothetical protein